MKRTICFILGFAVMFSTQALALEPLKDEDLNIAAPCAVLMEKSTGQVLYEKNSHDRLSPASITKIMTMLLIVEDIEAGKIKREDIVTASSRAASFGGSCVYLEAGEKMTVHEMLKCIAVASANDCAVAMAEHLSGTEALFVERMNERAQQLGLTDTHFTNCSGIFDDTEHYTSAYDVALMSAELIKHEMIKEYSTIWMDSIRNGEFELANTNKLVYWYPDCTGLKTGFTSKAKYCLAATAERDGMELIAVIMRSDSGDKRNEDATALLNYGFAGFSLCSLRADSPLPQLTVDMGSDNYVSLQYGGPENAVIPKNGNAPEYSLALPKRVSAPVKQGEKLGELIVSIGGERVESVPLLADRDVPRLGFFGIFGRLAKSLVGI